MEKLLEPEGVATSAPTATPRAKAVRVRRTKGKVATTGTASVKRWAGFGVGLMLILSAALNGYANAQRSPVAWAGWLMGVSVPVIVLTLAKVCGEKFRAGQKPIARFAGIRGRLLILSVWHCSQSIALRTGSPVSAQRRWPWRSTVDSWPARSHSSARRAVTTTSQPSPFTEENTMNETTTNLQACLLIYDIPGGGPPSATRRADM